MNEMNSQEVSETSALNEDQIVEVSASVSSLQSNQHSTKPTIKKDTHESSLDNVSVESANIDSKGSDHKLRHSQIPPQPDTLLVTTGVKLNGLQHSKDDSQASSNYSVDGQTYNKKCSSSSANSESILPEISVSNQSNATRIKHDSNMSDFGQDAADDKDDKGLISSAKTPNSTDQVQTSPPSRQLEEEFLRILFDTSKTYKDLDSQIVILRDIDDVEDQVMKELVRMVKNEKPCHQCRVNEIQHKQLPLCRACLKHNQVNHARFRTSHPGVNPLHHFRCFILETLERFSRQQRFRCTCEGGCRVDCPCLFPTNGGCVPCRFLRGAAIMQAYHSWPRKYNAPKLQGKQMVEEYPALIRPTSQHHHSGHLPNQTRHHPVYRPTPVVKNQQHSTALYYSNQYPPPAQVPHHTNPFHPQYHQQQYQHQQIPPPQAFSHSPHTPMVTPRAIQHCQPHSGYASAPGQYFMPHHARMSFPHQAPSMSSFPHQAPSMSSFPHQAPSMSSFPPVIQSQPHSYMPMRPTPQYHYQSHAICPSYVEEPIIKHPRLLPNVKNEDQFH